METGRVQMSSGELRGGHVGVTSGTSILIGKGALGMHTHTEKAANQVPCWVEQGKPAGVWVVGCFVCLIFF